MSEKGVIHWTRKITCILTAAILTLGINVSPVRADAAEAAASEDFHSFTMTAGDFCNWKEEMLDVTAWDYQY